MKLFINDTTAFYKKKLYNRISERADILVIYTGYQCEGRNADFSKGCMNYPHIFLTGNKLKKIYQIYHYIKHCDYDELYSADGLIVSIGLLHLSHRKEKIL